MSFPEVRLINLVESLKHFSRAENFTSGPLIIVKVFSRLSEQPRIEAFNFTLKLPGF